MTHTQEFLFQLIGAHVAELIALQHRAQQMEQRIADLEHQAGQAQSGEPLLAVPQTE